MRPNEAKYIGKLLGRLSIEKISPLINLGSSTREFREVKQPHIHREIIEPLEVRGVEVVNVDLNRSCPSVRSRWRKSY